jgi:hypothetical protein
MKLFELVLHCKCSDKEHAEALLRQINDFINTIECDLDHYDVCCEGSVTEVSDDVCNDVM